MLRHQLEDHHAVGHLKRTAVRECKLVLTVAALVIERINVPAEFVHVLNHRQ